MEKTVVQAGLGKKQDPVSKITQKDWRCDSRGRFPVSQIKSPEFKPQYNIQKIIIQTNTSIS
jgi:hypothetical protein